MRLTTWGTGEGTITRSLHGLLQGDEAHGGVAVAVLVEGQHLHLVHQSWVWGGKRGVGSPRGTGRALHPYFHIHTEQHPKQIKPTAHRFPRYSLRAIVLELRVIQGDLQRQLINECMITQMNK